MIANINKSVGTTPLAPADHIPLLKVEYAANILQDKFATFGGINYFHPEVQFPQGDLALSQSMLIRYKNVENPFDQVNVSDVTYSHDQTCPAQMEMDCTAGCISTAPSWRSKEVRFDKLYRVGASWCVETEKLTLGTVEERFNENLAAANKVQGVFAWNAFMNKAIAAAKATETMIPTDKDCFAHHHIDGKDASVNAYELISKAISYMKVVFGMQDYAIFAHRYLEEDLVAPGASIYNSFGQSTANANAGATTVNQELVQGGWKPMGVLGGKLFGETIYLAPDDIFFYKPSVNKGTGAITGGAKVNSYNPFLSADGLHYYVVIASRRSFLTGVVPLMETTHFPATCDNKQESIQASFLGYNELLFPQEIFVLEFDVSCPAVIVEAA